MNIEVSHEPMYYRDIINLLSEIKLTLGGQGLLYTLNRHKSIKKYIVDYQRDSIAYYEKLIDSHN